MKTTNMPVGVDHHPHWCALGDECQEPRDPRHVGGRTRYMPSKDDVQITLDLVRIDSTNPRMEENSRGETRTMLTLYDVSSMNLDGSPIIAAVDLPPADARHLADLLCAYADRCENEHTDLGRREVVGGLGALDD